jgi:nicotinic acid phosphoribosyltransferase
MLRVTVRSNRFRAVGSRLQGDVDALLSRVTHEIEADWKAGVRVDTGNYRRSIQTDPIPGGYAVQSPTTYGPFEEFGTRHMRGSHAAAQAASKGKTALERGAKGLLK